MSLTYPHRSKSQGVSGDLGGQSRRCSNLFERPCIYKCTYTARPLACQLASPLKSGNFSYPGAWRAASDICQGQVQPAHLTTPIGRAKYKFCCGFYTAKSIMEAKGSGALAAPNALCPGDSKLQRGPLLLISGERVEFNPPHSPTPSTRSSTADS